MDGFSGLSVRLVSFCPLSVVSHMSLCFAALGVTLRFFAFLERRNYQLHPERVRPTIKNLAHHWTQKYSTELEGNALRKTIPDPQKEQVNLKASTESSQIFFLALNQRPLCWSHNTHVSEPPLHQDKRIQQSPQERLRESVSGLYLSFHMQGPEDWPHTTHFTARCVKNVHLERRSVLKSAGSSAKRKAGTSSMKLSGKQSSQKKKVVNPLTHIGTELQPPTQLHSHFTQQADMQRRNG